MRSTSPASPALSSIDAHPKRVATGSKAADEQWELARRVEQLFDGAPQDRVVAHHDAQCL
jgi:hypothetical protein